MPDYALENDERFGIWGGLSERERRRLKRLTPHNNCLDITSAGRLPSYPRPSGRQLDQQHTHFLSPA